MIVSYHVIFKVFTCAEVHQINFSISINIKVSEVRVSVYDFLGVTIGKEFKALGHKVDHNFLREHAFVFV